MLSPCDTNCKKSTDRWCRRLRGGIALGRDPWVRSFLAPHHGYGCEGYATNAAKGFEGLLFRLPSSILFNPENPSNPVLHWKTVRPSFCEIRYFFPHLSVKSAVSFRTRLANAERDYWDFRDSTGLNCTVGDGAFAILSFAARTSPAFLPIHALPRKPECSCSWSGRHSRAPSRFGRASLLTGCDRWRASSREITFRGNSVGYRRGTPPMGGLARSACRRVTSAFEAVSWDCAASSAS
jgi:hypothetical protein